MTLDRTVRKVGRFSGSAQGGAKPPTWGCRAMHTESASVEWFNSTALRHIGRNKSKYGKRGITTPRISHRKEQSMNAVQKMIDEAPDYCPITRLEKCRSFVFDEGAVYVPTPAYDAYTLPQYDPETQSFSRTKIDMDDNDRRETEWLCELHELEGHHNLVEILNFYNITSETFKIACEKYKEK